jgi:hypothetical protein
MIETAMRQGVSALQSPGHHTGAQYAVSDGPEALFGQLCCQTLCVCLEKNSQ